MVMACCVCRYTGRSHKNNTTSKLSYHRFPKDPCERQRWISATNIPNLNPGPNTVICSNHFRQEDYCPYASGIGKLRPNAVPSIFKYVDHRHNSGKPRMRRICPAPSPQIHNGNVPLQLILPKMEPPSCEFGTICRICLIRNTNFKRIIDIKLSETKTAIDFLRLLNIQFDESDELPQNLCMDCIESMKACAAFQQQCIDNNTMLRDILVKTKYWMTTGKRLDTDTGTSNRIIIEDAKTLTMDFDWDDFASASSDNGKSMTIVNKEHTEDSYLKSDLTVKNVKMEYCPLSPAKEYFTLIEEMSNNSVKEENSKTVDKKNSSIKQEISNGKISPLSPIATSITSNDSLPIDLTSELEVQNLFMCPYCPTVVATESGLAHHMSIHPERTFSKCPDCPKIFTNAADLLHHKLASHCSLSVPILECIYCRKVCPTQRALDTHERGHIQKRSYNKTYAVHLHETTTDNRPCNGPELSSYLESDDNCSSDRAIIAPHTLITVRTKPLCRIVTKCKICKKHFLKRTILQHHMREHIGDKPFKCTICKSAFTLRSTLQTHYREHMGEKTHSCVECTCHFQSRRSYIHHMHFHNTTYRPFRCPHCTKTYSHRYMFTAHLRSKHLRKKPFTCKHCLIAFEGSVQLSNHLQTHSYDISDQQ